MDANAYQKAEESLRIKSELHEEIRAAQTAGVEAQQLRWQLSNAQMSAQSSMDSMRIQGEAEFSRLRQSLQVVGTKSGRTTAGTQ